MWLNECLKNVEQRDQPDTRGRTRADGLPQTNKIARDRARELELERDGAKPDGLTQTNEIASKSQRYMELSLMAKYRLMRQLERDGAKPDGLTQTSEISSKHRESIERGREEIWSYLDILGTDRLSYGLTELFLKLLSQLKKSYLEIEVMED